jgi:hypothetical protein
VSPGIMLQLFQKNIIVPSSSGSSSPRRVLDPEDEGTTLLRNIGKYLPVDTG